MSAESSPRNILITGAAGGFGSELAVACARAGARVLLVGRELRALERTCERVERNGGPEAGYCQFDLAAANPDNCAELVDAFTGAYGDLHALVHGAARFEGLRPLDQVPGDQWLRGMQVNVNAAWLLTTLCLPSLRSRPGARIVFMLDDPERSRSAYWGVYGVAKAAVRAMAEIFAEELEGSGCIVLGVEPGPMRTALRAAAYLGEDPGRVPAARHAAEKVAQMVLGDDTPAGVIARLKPD